MALAPYNVLDAAGATVALNKVPSTPGVRADMLGVGLSDEDRTLLQTLLSGVAHDASAAAVNPSLLGLYALAHGTNPTAVAAADATRWYANRAGVPFMIGGHPNIQSEEWVITGANTDQLLKTVAAGSKMVVTQAQASMSGANTVVVGLRLGLATATLPAASPTAAAAGIILSGKFAANGGCSRGTGAGIIATGADDADLRITNDAPTSGDIRVMVSYYTIES